VRIGFVRERLEIDPLAVNGRERIPMLPFVPTVFEAGYLVNDRLWPDPEAPTAGPARPLTEVDLARRRSKWHGSFGPYSPSPASARDGDYRGISCSQRQDLYKLHVDLQRAGSSN
jgi:hypothetical protein